MKKNEFEFYDHLLWNFDEGRLYYYFSEEEDRFLDNLAREIMAFKKKMINKHKKIKRTKTKRK